MNREPKMICPASPNATQRSKCQFLMGSAGLRPERRRRYLSSSLPHFVLQHPLPHPSHRETVGEAAEGAVHRAVLRLAELASAVVHRHLDDAVAGVADERR